MRGTAVVFALVAGTLVLVATNAPPVAAAAGPPTPDEVVALIDGVVFHYDRQDGLVAYTAMVSEQQTSKLESGGDSEPREVALGRLSVDVEGKTHTFTPEGGDARALGAFTPSCGPWRLHNVMQIEATLFATPLDEQFPTDRFERFVARRSGGFALRFKAKTPIGEPQPFAPAVTSVSLHVTAEGVPYEGILGLDQQIFNDPAKLQFEFDEVDGKHRIKTIENALVAANLGVKPNVRFTFEEVEELTLLRRIAVAVDTADVSGALSQMMSSMTTSLEFSDYEITHAVPPVPDTWDGVTMRYLRRQLGTPFPGDEIAGILPEPAKPPKDRKIGAVRRRMYLPHGLRLTFSAGDVLTEALIRVKAGNGFAAFDGDLLDGVTSKSTRADVEAALGEPSESKSSSKTTTVTYPALLMDIVYEGKAAGPAAAVVALVVRAPTPE